MTTAIETFAAFCARTTLATLPKEVVDTAKHKIADSLACAFAGETHTVSQLAHTFSETLPPGDVSSVLNARKVPPLDACFLNGVFIHAILQDDIDLATGHPACTVIGPALAMADALDRTGPELLASIVLGYEAMWRIGGRGAFLMAASARGFRGNTILGVFGSATAVAYLMGLDERGIGNAIAIAASFGAGLLEPLNRGSIERALQQGANARQGAQAAYLARAGAEGCLDVLNGGTGFYRAFAGLQEIPTDAMTDLGKTFRIGEAFAKPYPSAGSNTVGLAVVELLVSRHKLRASDVRAVRMRVLPRFTGVPGYPSIAFKGPFTTVEETLISFPFQVAAMLTDGTVDLESLRRALVDPAVADLARRVELIGVDVPHPLWCAVDIERNDGTVVSATSDEIDWKEFYVDEAAAGAKLRTASAGRMSGPAAQRLVNTIFALDTTARPRGIAEALWTTE